MTFEDFLADDRTFDPVMRNLQITGESPTMHPLLSYPAPPQIGV